MKFKIIILMLVLLFLPTLVNADWLEDGSCEVDTECVISRLVINTTNGEIVNSANCTITIYDIDENLLIYEDQMINSSSGYYNYTIDIGTVGKYPSIMDCNRSNNLDSADVTFIVSGAEERDFYLYLGIVIIALLLIFLGNKYEDNTFTFFAGVLFITLSILVFKMGYSGFENQLVLNAFALVLLGLGFYIMLSPYLQEFEGGIFK